MNRILRLTLCTLLTLTLAACSKDDEEAVDYTQKRVVLVYMVAENNDLDEYSDTNFNEIVAGSKSLSKNTEIVCYIDNSYRNPTIKKVVKGNATTQYQYSGLVNSVDPEKMREVLQKMITDNPAGEYSLVMWGHGTGSLFSEDTIATTATRAYGCEYIGKTYKWINTPAMAQVFKNLRTSQGETVNFKVLLFDCCLMQNVEVAYELRDAAQYIVASPSESPARGAPYATMLPAFEQSAETAARQLVGYIGDYDYSSIKISGTCVSAIKTSELEGFLQATREALLSINNGTSPLQLSTTPFIKDSISFDYGDNISDCLYYAKMKDNLSLDDMGWGKYNVMYDMKDIMRSNLTLAEYYKWLAALERLVIERRRAKDIRDIEQSGFVPWASGCIQNNAWHSFYLCDETYGGISMLFPSATYASTSPNFNKVGFKSEWWNKVGWKELGWQE